MRGGQLEQREPLERRRRDGQLGQRTVKQIKIVLGICIQLWLEISRASGFMDMVLPDMRFNARLMGLVF